MKLVVAARDFTIPSQTFVRQHVDRLRPGDTGLISISSLPAAYAHMAHLKIGGDRRFEYQLAQENSSRRINQTGKAPSRVLTYSDRAKVVRFVRALDASCVLAEFGDVGLLLSAALAKTKARLFVHFHGVDASAWLQDRRFRDRIARAMPQWSGVIAPSGHLANELLGVAKGSVPIHIIPCGVELRSNPSINRPFQGKYIFVGRLVEKKRPDLTIRAFAKVSRLYDRATLTIVGEGPMRDECRRLVLALGVSGSVKFEGQLSHPEVLTLIEESEVLLQHSVTSTRGDKEGIPLAILEAMAAGRPVVATDHAGISEAVKDGLTGFIVGEGEVNRMAAAMLTFFSEPYLHERMGAAARDRARQDFSIEGQTSKLARVLFD